MKVTRRLLCLLLALAMVMTLTPAVAFAEEVTEEAETDRTEATVPAEEAEADRIEATVPAEEPDEEIPETGPVTVEIPFRVNPLYEGLITEADLDIPELPEKDPSQVQTNASYHLTVEAAGVELRKQLKNRKGTFTIYVTAESGDAQAVSDSMLEIALEHTGVATEGDYIAWQFGGYGGQATRSYNETTQMYEYTLEFTAAYYTTAAQEQQMNTAVNKLINSLGVKGKSDYDKIYGVYDWLCKNVTYDYENLEDTTYMLKHTAYAALIDRTAVCQGYAVLFYRLMLELGVDARVIVGWGGGPHAWNIVELDGLYYNLDSTWDAGQSEYIWFMNNLWDFIGHEREMEYDTLEFHEAYPIAAETYEPGKAATKDPYFAGGYCGTEDNGYLNAMWGLKRDGTLVIRGVGNTYDYNDVSELPYYRYWKDLITKVVVEEGITGLGTYAFWKYPNLEEAEIAGSVKYIGASCFRESAALRQVTIHDGLEHIGDHAFYELKELTTFRFPATLKSIGDYAFYDCEKLIITGLPEGMTDLGISSFSCCDSIKTLTLPSSLCNIKFASFSRCAGLECVTFTNGRETLGKSIFSECYNLREVVLPDTLKSIDSGAFKSCRNLEQIDLPQGLEIIGEGAFFGSGLKEIQIPESVTQIMMSAFQAAPLAKANLPKGLTTIEERIFCGCPLTAIEIPAGVTVIGKGAFTGAQITSLEVPEGVVRIEDSAFYGNTKLTQVSLPESLEYLNGFSECTALTEIVVPSNVATIDSYAFWRCTSLTSIVIPDTVTKIGAYAFDGCTSLKSLRIPSGINTLSSYLARNCTALTEIIIPENIVYIGGKVFYGCSSLKQITFIGDAPIPPNQDKIVFLGVTATAYYPASNTTWTEEIMQYYGGTITWVPYEGSYEPTVKWSSISTSLGGNIAMNFYVELSEDLVADPDAYIQFSFAGRTVKVSLSQGKPSDKNGVTVYQFSCPITSKNMTDEITAQIYLASEPVGEPKTMSVDTYCNWVIANFKDEKTVNLMKGMLNYGASAQKLFNYRTDDLANATLAEEDKVFGAVDASTYKHSVVGIEDGIIAKSMTLLLDSETTVRVYFELTGDKTIEDYTFTVDGVEVEPKFKDGKYYVERPNISAHRLDDMHVFTCGGITVTYGGLSYVNQVMTYYTEGTTFDMASALYAYSKAAEAYIG